MDYTQNARIARLRRRLIRESNRSRHSNNRQFHMNRIGRREIRRNDAVQNISPSTDPSFQTTLLHNTKVGTSSTRRDIISHSIVTLDGKVVTTTLEATANVSNIGNSNYCGYTITNIRAAIEASTRTVQSGEATVTKRMHITPQTFSSVRNQVSELQETICNTTVDGRNDATKSNCLPKCRNDITESSRPPKRRKFSEPWYFGGPNHVCRYCAAILWYEERNDKSKKTSNPKFSLCCQEGKVLIPLLKEAPPFLVNMLTYNTGPSSAKFRENIRGYNSIFAFTSTGANVDNRFNNGRSPYVYRISGQNHHKIGSLLPIPGEKPKFAQLYIYDTDNEVSNRMKVLSRDKTSSGLDPVVVQELVQMLDTHNELAKMFRMARDRFQESDVLPVRIKLIGTRSINSNVYNLPTASEIAALIVGDIITI